VAAGWEITHLPRLNSAAALFAALLFCGTAAAADPAHVSVAGPLQAQPLAGAPATGTIKAGTAVDIIARKGFWAQVKGGALTGWLKLGRLSLDGGGGSGSDIAALASGRTGSGNVVNASGGRGLDATDFARATPDTAAVAALAHSAASEAQAAQFAAAGKLKTRQMAYVGAAR
jgi:hypothetical protein